MFALADINSFYASCEKVFRPDLRNEPVIVLSNNDGCVIARSPEAKALGIRMGQPWFQVRQMRLEKKIHVFSSNYALYHSMSQRVMAVLESLSPAVEPYSIAKWHLNRSQFGIRIDHDLASISDHSLASQSITIWHASDH